MNGRFLLAQGVLLLEVALLLLGFSRVLSESEEARVVAAVIWGLPAGAFAVALSFLYVALVRWKERPWKRETFHKEPKDAKLTFRLNTCVAVAGLYLLAPGALWGVLYVLALLKVALT